MAYVTATFTTTGNSYNIGGQTLTFNGNATITDTGTNPNGILGGWNSSVSSIPANYDQIATIHIVPEDGSDASDMTIASLAQSAGSNGVNNWRIHRFNIEGLTAGGNYYTEADILNWANSSGNYTGDQAPEDLVFETVSGGGQAVLLNDPNNSSEEVIAAFSAAHGGLDSLQLGSWIHGVYQYNLNTGTGIEYGGPDGIVDGTSADDIMHAGYDDGEGDTIGDADGSHDDIVKAGAGDDNIKTGQGNDTIYGQEGNDTIAAGSGDDIVFGGAGEDTILGGIGNDVIKGGEGNDNITGGEGNDTLHGDAGDDTIDGSEGDDEIRGGIGNDTLDGGDGNDDIYGGEGSDTIDGGAGVDIIRGLEDNDTLTGGTGNDTFIYTAGDGIDTITDFGVQDGGNDDGDATNNDVLDLTAFYTEARLQAAIDAGEIDGDVITSPLQWAQADLADDGRLNGSYGGADAGFEVNDAIILTGVSSSDLTTENTGLAGPIPDGVVDGTSGADYMTDGYTDGDGDAIGDSDGSHDDVVEGGAGNDEIHAGEGIDTVDGGAGDDRIFGDAGADTLTGGADQDQIEGGDGDDHIEGGDDDDLLYGDAGNDTMSGDAGDDVVHGGVGDDTVSGGAGEDYLYGDDGADTIDGGADNDAIYGGAGDDTISGGSGSDYIEGNAGDDTIDGGTGDDNIKGGDGNDTLEGGTGDDWLTGGAGNDTFTYTAGDGADYITDFGTQDGTATDGDNDNNDVLDLSDFYSQANYDAAVANGEIDGTVIKNPLQWMQADLDDDGKLNGSQGDAGFTTGDSITLTGVSGSDLTYENTRVLCLTRGTMVKTSEGARLVEDLIAGDMVLTDSNGYQPIRLALSRVITSAELDANPAFLPIVIRQGALGAGLPSADLRVSPQHRMLASSSIAKRMFNEGEVLISAKKMLGLKGVEVDEGASAVEYFHLIFDRHEIIFANDCPTESFSLGVEALKSLSDEALVEVVALFPQVMKRDFIAGAARQIPLGAQQKQFIHRTAKNNQKFLAEFYA